MTKRQTLTLVSITLCIMAIVHNMATNDGLPWVKHTGSLGLDQDQRFLS